jgi:hypothetical protein
MNEVETAAPCRVSIPRGVETMSVPFQQHARPVETFLTRLDRVKQTGPDRWIGICPAHPDKSPSLAIRELEDWRILLYCRTGCATADILAAVGLEFSDLYPPKPITATGIKPERRPFPARDLLGLIALEATVVLIAARDMLEAGDLVLGDAEFARLALAADRIETALTVSGVSRHG